MKFITVRDAKATLSNAIAESEEQRVVITRHGRPVCMMVGCEGYEIEDVPMAADPAFWKMIAQRRAGGRTRSLASVRERFARSNAAKRKPRAKE